MPGKTAFVEVAILAAAIMPTVVFGQTPETVPEALARGATGSVRSAPSGMVPSIEDVLRETELVVRGTVGESRSYLSEDAQNVYTEYTIKKPLILYTTNSISSRQPGPVQQIAVSQLGGTLVINGQSFTQTENGLTPLEFGTEALLLLKRVGSRWLVAKTFYGAFNIENGKLRSLARRRFAEEFRDAEATGAIPELLARLHAVKQRQ
jgi:hypothetical protein